MKMTVVGSHRAFRIGLGEFVIFSKQVVLQYNAAQLNCVACLLTVIGICVNWKHTVNKLTYYISRITTECNLLNNIWP